MCVWGGGGVGGQKHVFLSRARPAPPPPRSPVGILPHAVDFYATADLMLFLVYMFAATKSEVFTNQTDIYIDNIALQVIFEN